MNSSYKYIMIVDASNFWKDIEKSVLENLKEFCDDNGIKGFEYYVKEDKTASMAFFGNSRSILNKMVDKFFDDVDYANALIEDYTKDKHLWLLKRKTKVLN